MLIGELRRELAAVAAGLEPRVLSAADARAALEDAAAIRNIAARLVGRLAPRVAEGAEWRRAGFASEEQWLAAVTGSSAGAARDVLVTARRLDELDVVAGAADRGELSPEQLTAIADAAAADPSAQDRLLAAAKRKPLGQLKDACAQTKRAADRDPEATHARLVAARRLRFSRALDGASQILGCSTPEQMSPVKAAIEKRANELFDAARRAGRHEPRDAYLMDALEQICRDWLDGGRSDQEPKQLSSRPAWLGLLRIDVEALQRGSVEGEEICEITGVGPVPVSVARRLLGESVLKLVITRGVDVVNVTHLGRAPTVAQRMALLWSSPGCCVTACARRAGIEHDHTEDWAATRHTVLGELRRLCDHHHDLKTHQGWAFIERADGSIDCVAPDDPRHPGNASARAGPDPPADADPSPEPHLFDHDAA
jgi:Domain of unknown function (DUF222)